MKKQSMILIILLSATIMECAMNHHSVIHSLNPGAFIRTWLVCGEFPNEDRKSIDRDFLTSLGGETDIRPRAGLSVKKPDGSEAVWAYYASNDDQINFLNAFQDHPCENVLSYAFAQVQCDGPENLFLSVGSDDGVKVILNGNTVHRYPVGRGVFQDDDIFAVELKEGVNDILVKVEQGGGGWGFMLRFLEEEDTKDLLITESGTPAPGKQVPIIDDIPGPGIDGYWQYLPENHSVDKKWPVLLFFSSTAQAGGNLRKVRDLGPVHYALNKVKGHEEVHDLLSHNFIILNPHLKLTREEKPHYHEDIASLDAILKTTIDKYNGDPSRIYVMGFSTTGADDAWAYPELGDMPCAAIVPITTRNFRTQNFKPLKELGIWAMHNAGDPVVPYEKSANAIKTIEENLNIEFTKNQTLPAQGKDKESRYLFSSFQSDAHDAWSAAFSSPQLYRWLLQFSR